MEQANMMQNNMAAQAQMSAMQRPQPGNLNQQLFAQTVNDLKNGMGEFNGTWRATLDPRTRASYVMQLITALRMLEPDVRKCMGVARKFELTSLGGAQNKQQYDQLIQAKLEEIKQKRAQNNGQMMVNGMPGVSLQQPMMQPQMGNMTPASQANGFPGQLTRPMQPSMVQPQPQSATMDPAFLMANAQQPSAPFPPGMNPNENGNAPRQQDDSMALNEEITRIARKTLDDMSDDKKNQLRQTLFNGMNEMARNHYLSKGNDPLKQWAIQKARQAVLNRNAATQAAHMPPQNMQRNQAFANNEQMNAAQQAQANNNNFSLAQLYGQQASAMKMQESGEQVVPVSENGAFGNNTQNNAMNMLGNANALPDAQRRMLLQQQQQQNQKQLHDQLVHQQNNLARAQALNVQHQAGGQNNALTGQPGGLNAPANFNLGQMTSPAMSTLTRPFHNAADQSNMGMQGLQGGFPPFQRGDANAIAQQHQNMISQNNNGNMLNRPMNNNNNNAQYMALLSSLGVDARNKLLAMTPAERNNALARLKSMQEQKLAQSQAQNRSAQPSGPVQENIAAQNAQLGRPQPPAGPGNVQMTTEQQAQRQRQQQILKGQAMLSRPLPRHMSNHLQIAIPPSVQKWGQLRQHIQVNAGMLPPDMPARMMTAMERHFHANPLELQQAMRDVLAIHQQQQQLARNAGGLNNNNNNAAVGNNQQPFMNQPGAPQPPAPTATMSRGPAGQLRLPPGVVLPQISDQDIAQQRQMRNIGPEISDVQIRNVLMQHRIQQIQKANQQSQGPPGAAPFSNRTPTQPGGAQPRPLSNQQPAQPSRKAPTNDDVVEIPPPAFNNRKAPTTASVQKVTPTQMPMPTPEQLSRMSKERREQFQQQMAQMQKTAAPAMRPSPSQMNDVKAQVQKAHKATLTRLYQELGPLPQKGGPVKVESNQVNELRALFRRMWKPLQALEQSFLSAYKVIPGFNDDRAKSLIRAKSIMDQNIADEEGNIKGHLSSSATVLKQLGEQIMRYYTDLQRSTPKKADQQQMEAQIAGQAAAQRGQQQAGQAPAPTMAVSKSQASNKSSTKPPAAPVDDKRFNWNNVPSPTPHGVPKYDTHKPDLTPDQLKIPAIKKRKTGANNASQPTTPGQISTPVATPKLPATANVKAQPVKPVQEVEKQRFRCTQFDCEASISGFDTQAQLASHVEAAHAPIADPFQFLMDATNSVISSAKATQALKAKPAASVAMSKRPSKRSSDGTPVPVKATSETVPKVVEAEVEKSFADFAADKIGYADSVKVNDVSEQNNSDDTFMAGLGDNLLAGLEDIDGLFGDSAMVIEDWGLGIDAVNALTPPELTPGGTGSDTSHNSDISANDQLRINMSWDPFHIGDTHVPSFLQAQDEMQTLISNHAPPAAPVADATGDNNDGSVDKPSVQGTKDMSDNWAWSNDNLNWDDFMMDMGSNDGQNI